MNDIFDYGYTFLQGDDRLSNYYLLLIGVLCGVVAFSSMISYPNVIRIPGTIHIENEKLQISYIIKDEDIPQILEAKLYLLEQIYSYQVIQVTMISDQGYYKVLLQGEPLEATWLEELQVTLTFELGKTTFYEQIKKKMKGWFLSVK